MRCRGFTTNDQKERFSLPDVLQELVELEGRKLGEPAAGEGHLIWANCAGQWNQVIEGAPKETGAT